MKKIASIILSGTLLVNVCMFSFTNTHASNVSNLGEQQTINSTKVNGLNEVSNPKALPPTLLLLTVAYAFVTATDRTNPTPSKRLTTGYADASTSSNSEEIALTSIN